MDGQRPTNCKLSPGELTVTAKAKRARKSRRFGRGAWLGPWLAEPEPRRLGLPALALPIH